MTPAPLSYTAAIENGVLVLTGSDGSKVVPFISHEVDEVTSVDVYRVPVSQAVYYGSGADLPVFNADELIACDYLQPVGASYLAAETYVVGSSDNSIEVPVGCSFALLSFVLESCSMDEGGAIAHLACEGWLSQSFEITVNSSDEQHVLIVL